jgi:prepilin-type processing-associated H-X9-DG protein
MKTNPKNQPAAFTLIELIAVVATLALLAMMLLPALAQDSQNSTRRQCVNNLKQVALAFRIWANDNSDKFPMAVSTKKGGTTEFVPGGNVFRHFQVMSNELNTPKLLICPSDTRTFAANFADLHNENISYFVGLDANDTQPQMFLSGDRNIENGQSPIHSVLDLRPKLSTHWTATIHTNQGNVALADGSVQQYTSVRLQQALQYTGDTTNRIALPE